jgi:predicted permease
VFQVALSVILVIGAGLFLRTLDNLKSVDLGFQRENLLLISFDPARSGYERVRVGSFFDQLLQRIREQPGVKAASLASHGSLSGVLPIGTRFINTTMHAEGSEPKPGEDSIYYKNFVAPSYFDTVGTRLVRGRDFNPHDYRDNPRAAIVNETAARDLFKGADPIGKHIGHSQSGPADIEIVGVVKDAKYLSVREAPLRIVYFPFHGSSPMTLHVRTSTDAKMMIPIIRRETHALDPNVPLFHIQTMTTRIDDSLREERLVFTLGSTLGVLGTLLAAVGLYGVLSYSVIQRSREIGIRVALGAQRADVLGMALRQGMKLACVGIVIGMMGAVGLTVLLRNMLFGVSPTDPLTFAVVTLLLAGVALLASWLPARRAAKVDPIVALKYE